MPTKNLKLLNYIFYLLVVLLVIMLFVYERVYYLNITKDSFTLEKYLADPQTYGSHKSERLAKITNISKDHFYINSEGREIKVIGSNATMAILGESVFFLDFKKDGKIELIDYHNYDYNYILYLISVVALIIFVIVFFKEWKLTRRGFEDA